MEFSTIVEAVAHYAKVKPDKTCLIEAESGRQFTYGEFWSHIVLFSARLKKGGVQKGDRVVVRVGALLETLTAQFGIYMTGGVYCPVERHIKELALKNTLDYFETDRLISDIPVAGVGVWIALSTVCDSFPAGDAELLFPDADDLCAIIFTTGTTGKAKGVMLSYKTIYISTQFWVDAYDFTEEDVFLWITPLDRINGIRRFGQSFIVGGTAVYYSGIVFIKNFFEVIGKYKIHKIHLQPFTLAIFLKNFAEGFGEYADQLKSIILAGGFISESHILQLKALLPRTRLFIQYGATEVSPISFLEITHCSLKPGCVGKPAPGVSIRILDDTGNEICSSKDTWGIIECESDIVMTGYWKALELTKTVLTGKRVKMADMGYFDEDGLLYLVGRRDDVIVSGGFKIAPYEIENIALQIPGVSEAVCISVPDNILGSVPRLFVTMKECKDFSAKEITNFLAIRLETFKIPRTIRLLDDFPRVAGSQKIDRKELRKYD